MTINLNMALLDKVEMIAREAGAAIMEFYDRDYSTSRKADMSPVTEADLAAHSIIMAGLSELEHVLPILSEEAIEDFLGLDAFGCYWLVDPLDGTKEFISRNGEFTVNIALIDCGRPVLGMVYAPALNVVYSAMNGFGSFKASENALRIPIHVAAHSVKSIWRVVASRSHANDTLRTFLEQLGLYEIVPMGSSLKLCLVAEGGADIYPRLSPTSLWDTAAAQCVVEQAGGKVIQLSGESLSYANPAVTINPFFLVCGSD